MQHYMLSATLVILKHTVKRVLFQVNFSLMLLQVLLPSEIIVDPFQHFITGLLFAEVALLLIFGELRQFLDSIER